MEKIKIDRNNYDKFIFAGSLALECYNDDNDKYENLYMEFNKKLREYRNLLKNIEEEKEQVVKELILTMEKMGIENFLRSVLDIGVEHVILLVIGGVLGHGYR